MYFFSKHFLSELGITTIDSKHIPQFNNPNNHYVKRHPSTQMHWLLGGRQMVLYMI